MVAPTLLYTLSEIEEIKNKGFEYTIHEDILKVIKHISSQVGAENYVKTPQFTTKNKNYANKQLNQEAWAAIRNFKVTERVERKGVDKFLQELRGELNKLTEKNFTLISDNIFEKMTADLVSENKEQISKHIFEIASTNKFYSSVYAKLFKMILDKFDFMSDVFSENLENYMNLFNNINSADPNVDYDRFCDINKENEKRKAMSQFFANLMHEKIITKEKILEIVNALFKMMFEYVEMVDKKAECVEIVENIFIIVKSIMCKLETTENDSIKEKVDLLTSMKPSNNNSMTNKILFKYMDLADEF